MRCKGLFCRHLPERPWTDKFYTFCGAHIWYILYIYYCSRFRTSWCHGCCSLLKYILYIFEFCIHHSEGPISRPMTETWNCQTCAISLFTSHSDFIVFIFECFNLGTGTITSLDTSKWKFHIYAFCQVNTTPMARSWWFMATLWWKDSHLNALIMCHLKRQYNWRWHVFCMQTRNSLCLISCINPYIL